MALALYALVVVQWPRLSVRVLVLVLGARLVVWGARGLWRWWRARRRGAAAGARSGLAGAVTSLAVAAVLVVLSAVLLRGDAPLVPDDFYATPATLPAEPGRLLRFEQVDALEGPAAAEASTTWRILYTTTALDPSSRDATHIGAASGVVLLPQPEPGAHVPVLAYAHGTSGVAPGCAPSLTDAPLADGPQDAALTMLGDGWAVVSTDYAGLGTAGRHAYLVGEPAAWNVLDAVRAAHELVGELASDAVAGVPADVALAGTTAVWGHSQGGHAALWTGALAPAYAPELDVVGVAALAPAADLVALADGIKDTAVGRVVSAYIGVSWRETFPGIDVSGAFAPGTETWADAIAQRCFHGFDALSIVLRSTQVTTPVFRAEALDGPLGDELRANVPAGHVDAPLLVAQGLDDSLVLADSQRAWVAARCADGQALDFREYAGLDHMPLVAADSPATADLVAWTQARLAGTPPTPTCG